MSLFMSAREEAALQNAATKQQEMRNKREIEQQKIDIAIMKENNRHEEQMLKLKNENLKLEIQLMKLREKENKNEVFGNFSKGSTSEEQELLKQAVMKAIKEGK